MSFLYFLVASRQPCVDSGRFISLLALHHVLGRRIQQRNSDGLDRAEMSLWFELSAAGHAGLARTTPDLHRSCTPPSVYVKDRQLDDGVRVLGSPALC